MHTVFALLCFVVVIHWLIFPYPSGLLHWHCGNLTIAPVPAKQPWWIWINSWCEFIMNDCITTTKQNTTKPCAYFWGYTVYLETAFGVYLWQKCQLHMRKRCFVEINEATALLSMNKSHSSPPDADHPFTCKHDLCIVRRALVVHLVSLEINVSNHMSNKTILCVRQLFNINRHFEYHIYGCKSTCLMSLDSLPIVNLLFLIYHHSYAYLTYVLLDQTVKKKQFWSYQVKLVLWRRFKQQDYVYVASLFLRNETIYSSR